MMPGSYYHDPRDDWRLCDRCHMRPAAWVVNPGTDAGLYCYCDPCMPGRWTEWAQPYTPARNQMLDESAEWLRRSQAREKDSGKTQGSGIVPTRVRHRKRSGRRPHVDTTSTR